MAVAVVTVRRNTRSTSQSTESGSAASLDISSNMRTKSLPFVDLKDSLIWEGCDAPQVTSMELLKRWLVLKINRGLEEFEQFHVARIWDSR